MRSGSRELDQAIAVNAPKRLTTIPFLLQGHATVQRSRIPSRAQTRYAGFARCHGQWKCIGASANPPNNAP